MTSKIGNILNEYLKIEGVKSVALVGRDGFVIDSAASGDIDIEALGAMVATAIGSSEILGQEFELGDMSQYLVEFKGGKIIIAAVGNDILALFTDNSAVIGGVRYYVKKHIDELANAL